jgi:hypothetical protein
MAAIRDASGGKYMGAFHQIRWNRLIAAKVNGKSCM